MSAKRIAKSSVDWAKIAATTNEVQMDSFRKFRALSEAYLRRVQMAPENPPPIDWNKYKSVVSNKDVVDRLEASFKSVLSSIPYPKDSLAEEIDRKEKQDSEENKTLLAHFEERNDECLQMIEKFEKMIPIQHMTAETYAMTFPNWARWYYTETIDEQELTPSLSKEAIEEIKKPTRLDLEARF